MTERVPAGKIALIGVLGVVLIAILIRQYGGSLFTSENAGAKGAAETSHPPGASLSAGPGMVLSGSSDLKPRWVRPAPVAPMHRDPMLVELPKEDKRPEKEPGLAQTAVAPEFRVAGIVFNADQTSSIIIDGQILHEGKLIHGATVAKITREYGVLTRGDKSWIVKPGQSNREPE